MVLMAVGDHESLHLVQIFFQISYIGNDKIDPEHVILRESQSAIHHNNAVFILEGSDVHPDLL